MVMMAGVSPTLQRPKGQAPSVRVGFYDIEKTIGKGNFAVVKLAKHRITKTEVAIKIIDKSQLDESNMKKIYREVTILKMLSHQHIIKLYQRNKAIPLEDYCVAEIFVARSKPLSSTNDCKRIYCHCLMFSFISVCLQAENLLLDANMNIKIADFGFGNFFKEGEQLATWCGSPPYAAPEVFEGKKYTGPQVDIWSLGVVLYVLVCGALPFDGPTLQELRDRVVSGRFRIPYFMSTECESLIRRMLVLEPSRRYSIARIKTHEWMLMEGGGVKSCPPSPTFGYKAKVGQYNEQILRIMQSLGIDQQKTMEALHNDAYDHYTAIYYLLLDRLRQHRSSFPSDTRIDARRRRPSTIAEQAMLHMLPSQVMGLPRPQLSGMKTGRMSRTLDNTSPPTTQGPSLPHYSMLGGAEPEMTPPPPNVLHCMSDMLPRAPAPSPAPINVITTSIDEGVEADIMDREAEMSDMAAHSSRFAALQRDPYGLGLLPQYGYGYLDNSGQYQGGMAHRQSLSSANSSTSLNTIGLNSTLSPFTSFDSSLEVDVASGGSGGRSETLTSSAGMFSALQSSLPPMSSVASGNQSAYLQVKPQGMSMSTHITPSRSPPTSIPSLTHCPTVPARLGQDTACLAGDHAGPEEMIQDRGQTRSPVNFREGRRASDGLVAQGIIAFRQRLRECMRARGMVELRQEHHQLQTLYPSFHDTHSLSSPPDEECEEASAPQSASTTPPSYHDFSRPQQPLHPHRKLSAPHHCTRQWSLDEPGSGGSGTPTAAAAGRHRPLMKRMSLPSESFDIQPHRLLALKQSLHIEQQLDLVGNNSASSSQESLMPLPPTQQPQPPQAPPLPCTVASPHYQYSGGSKSLQQQLLAHRLQHKRQVFQKHSLPTHQAAPHPHPHPPHVPPHNNNNLPLPQQLSCQLQQLQIDPNNLPRIDFGPGYHVPHTAASQPLVYSPAASTDGQMGVRCSQSQSYSTGTPHRSSADYSTPHRSSADYSTPHRSSADYSTPHQSSSDYSVPHRSSADYSGLQLLPAYSFPRPSASHADTFLEQMGMGGNVRESQGNNDVALNLSKRQGEEEGGERKEEEAEGAKEPPSTPTHQWQRRTGVFMAVHPFQDSNAFNLTAAHTAPSPYSQSPGSASPGFPGSQPAGFVPLDNCAPHDLSPRNSLVDYSGHTDPAPSYSLQTDTTGYPVQTDPTGYPVQSEPHIGYPEPQSTHIGYPAQSDSHIGYRGQSHEHYTPGQTHEHYTPGQTHEHYTPGQTHEHYTPLQTHNHSAFSTPTDSHRYSLKDTLISFPSHTGFPSQINTHTDFLSQADPSPSFDPQTEPHNSFTTLSRPQVEHKAMFAPSLLSLGSCHDENFKNYLHALQCGREAVHQMQGLTSGMGAVDLMGFASQRAEPSLGGNSGMLGPAGDSPQNLQLGLRLGKPRAAGEFVMTQQNDDCMDTS
ncbi:serine/threonine-protein kinase SIK2-like [Littorina saxatilis]|uniref:serine/threonine-protein kinase SIK2-like n=1 Tax=Littorina saxatilis TaxID=31220 RepID=UPI0038B522BE